MRPVEGILPPAEVQRLIAQVQRHGGHVSFRNNPDGSQSAYELNISYFDALSDPDADEPQDVQVARFMAAHAVILALQGIPAIYVHSLLGSRNYPQGVAETGRFRSINREKLQRAPLEAELDRPGSLRAAVLTAFERLLAVRRAEPAFHPAAAQQVLDLGPELFAVRRQPQAGPAVLCLCSVVNRPVARSVPCPENAVDLLSGRRYEQIEGRVSVELPPYGVLWLKEASA